MRILIEPGSFHCLNAGDVVMMQVAYQRLRELWPGATIAIPTADPGAIATYCPGAAALDVRGRYALWMTGLLAPRVARVLPGLGTRLTEAELSWRYRHPGLGLRLVDARAPEDAAAAEAFADALASSDLVVASGAGQINDAFPTDANLLLGTIESAMARGIPTAMFGQGIGPVTDPGLLARCATVLPRVPLLALREGQTGPPILRAAGVPASAIRVTGDDAIAIAYDARAAELGRRIGVNVRVSEYTGARAFLSIVRDGLTQAASQLAAGFAPVAISIHERESDAAAAASLLQRLSDVVWPADNTVVANALAQVRRARVMVTGSYHGAVFALSQGIPVIGLSNTEYYATKFAGLTSQFGPACETFVLGGSGGASELTRRIVAAWHHAPAGREVLLDAARRQIANSRAAYAELPALVQGPR